MGVGRQGMMANEHTRICNNSYEKVQTFKYLDSLLTNQNSIYKEMKCKLKAGNSCYCSIRTLFSTFPSKTLKIQIYKIIILPVLLCLSNMVFYIKGKQANSI